jgi:prepilin-type N-terminal cleavage/methylation domain-containing protein
MKLRTDICPLRAKGSFRSNAFSMVEILLVVAVIAIISGMAITYVGGASENSRLLVARQQQVQLQTALDAWIVAKSSGTAGLAAAKTAYSTDAEYMLSAQGLGPYLREPGIFSVSGSAVSSSALAGAGKTLQFSSWSDGSYPKVLMSP